MLATVIATSIVLGTLFFIVTEKIDKVIAVLAGALLMIISGRILGFYSQGEALRAIDFNTLGLLLGMMITVSILKRTGFFTYVAISLAKCSKGKPWLLMGLLGVSTAFISMLVDNVTTIIIIGPISILVCDILGISPLPTLIAEVILSNIGGVGTLVGDPPNILIGSASGHGFNDFLAHLFSPVFVVIFITYFILLCIYKKQLQDKPKNFQAVLNINVKKAMKNPHNMMKGLIALGVTFTLFFLHERMELYPSFIALIGAALAFLLLRPDPEDIFHDVEWTVLAFFACFFVIVGGWHETGLLSYIAEKTAALAILNMKVYKIVILWVAGLAASFIGAVPFTMVMIPVIKSLSGSGIDIDPLWWILALGIGFGSNGLPIGSAASILGISISKKSRSPIDIKTWLSSATVVTLASLLFVTILILAGLF